MTLTLPPPTEKVVALHGGMNQTWYEKFKSAFKFIDTLNEAFGETAGEVAQLGTAAFKNIGTSGDSVPLLNTANTFSKSQTFDVVTLEDAASIAWDWSLGPIAKVTLGGNRTLAAPTTNGKAGTWALFIRQDGTGSRTLSFASSYLFIGGNDPTLSTAANAIDVLTCVSDGTSIACSLAKSLA